MKALIVILMLALAPAAYAQHSLSEQEKDSIKMLVCHMEQADQDVRGRWELAKKANDSAAMKLTGREWHFTDSINFVVLSKLVREIGYPCKQLLGQGACMPNAVLTHWCKNHPDWFCDRSLVPVFRKEIELGHLPLPVMDFCFFSYVSYMKADVKLLPQINAARSAYDLRPYTLKQYTQQEWIEPLMEDTNEARRKHKMRLKQTPERSSGH